MLSTLKKFANALSGTAVMQLATLVAALAVSNIFGPLGLSKFGIVQNTITTIASVLPFGLGYTSINYVNKHRESGLGLQVANFAMQACLLASLFFAFLLFLGASEFAQLFYSDPGLSILIVFAAIGIPFSAISFIQHAILNGFEAFADMARTAFISAFATIICVLAGSWAAGLTGAIVGLLLSLVLRAALLQIALNKYASFKLALPSMAIWRQIRHFAIPAGLAGLSLTPSTWYANSLLIKHGGLEAQGVIMAALTVRMAISFIPQQLSTVFLPQYLQSEGEPTRQHIKRLIQYVSILAGSALILCAAAFILREPLMAAFGKGFHADPLVFGLLLATVVLEATGLPLSYFYARREQMWRFLFVYTYPKDISLVLASIILVPAHGALGLAQAYFVSLTVGFSVLALSTAHMFWRQRQSV